MEENDIRKPPVHYSKRIVKKICDMVRADTYTQKEICEKIGIDKATFSVWKRQHPEFVDALEEAEDERMSRMVVEARNSLLKVIVGYDTKETKVKTVPSKKRDKNGKPVPEIKEQITSTRHVEPNITAIIFTLTNGDPEHFKNRNTQEITGVGGTDLFKSKTDEELAKEIEEYKRKLQMANGESEE